MHTYGFECKEIINTNSTVLTLKQETTTACCNLALTFKRLCFVCSILYVHFVFSIIHDKSNEIKSICINKHEASTVCVLL